MEKSDTVPYTKFESYRWIEGLFVMTRPRGIQYKDKKKMYNQEVKKITSKYNAKINHTTATIQQRLYIINMAVHETFA